MTPERAARLVSLWVRIYTRGLRAPTADRRLREIESDLHDQITHDRATGARERAIAVGILGRMIRGAVADVRWRGASGRPLHRSPLAVLLATALVLSVPAVAMLFTSEVRWGAADFVMAGLLLGGTGLLAQRALISRRGTVYGLAATVGLMAALLLAWACLAVGVVGAEDDPANLMFAGVLLIGVAGVISARFQPTRMARAMFAMAIAQGLAAVVALLAGKQALPNSSVAEILAVNGLFAGAFAVSGWLFLRATRRRLAGATEN